jgi:hypothetical protein
MSMRPSRRPRLIRDSSGALLPETLLKRLGT